MKSNIYKLLVVLLSVVVLTFSGCAKYKQIEFTSFNIESVSLNGLKAVDLKLSVEVDNPAGKIEVNSVECSLKHFGKVIGKVTPAAFVIIPRTKAKYIITAKVEVGEGVGLYDLMRLINMRKLNECTLDVAVSGKIGGVALKKEFADIPLEKLIDVGK